MPEQQWYLAFAWGRAPYALDLPEVVIGRGEGCTLQIDEAAAGDEHARFVMDDEQRVSIEDLGSGKATLVNGRAIATRTPLGDGDFVQIGNSVLTVRRRAAETAEAPPRQPDPGEQRVVGAKNFVVGEGPNAPQHLATLMMDSPVAGRPQQHTVEANVDELMAAIRRSSDAAATSGGAASRDEELEPAPTLIAPSPQRAPAPRQPSPKSTLIGMGVRDLPVPAKSTSAVTLESHALLDSTNPVERTDIVGDEEDDISRQPTRVASLPSQPSLGVRSGTQPDMTPLPAPLPPPVGSSVPDLSSYVARATAGSRRPTPEAVRLGSQPTMALPATDEAELARGETLLPRQVPAREKTKTPVKPEAIAEQRASRPLAPPTERVRPIDARSGALGPVDRVPSDIGSIAAFRRAVDFAMQMREVSRARPGLLKPLVYQLVIATAIAVSITLLLIVVHSGLLSLVGLLLLFLVSACCDALTVSLVNDYANDKPLDLERATARVKRSLSGIATFAAISGLLDFWASYARERNDVVAKALFGIIHAIWTTATYVIVPAMVVEGVPFRDALARGKVLMDRDPTGVGAGIVALSLTACIASVVIVVLASILQSVGNHIHIGALLLLLVVNVFWAVSGWVKSAYSTCFYVWSLRCEEGGTVDPAQAPAPLRHALSAA